eukprot:g7982.t1
MPPLPHSCQCTNQDEPSRHDGLPRAFDCGQDLADGRISIFKQHRTRLGVTIQGASSPFRGHTQVITGLEVADLLPGCLFWQLPQNPD